MKKQILAIICLLAVLCAACLWFLFRPGETAETPAEESAQTALEEAVAAVETAVAAPSPSPEASEEPEETPVSSETPEVSEEPEEEPEPYVSPVDFEALWAINPEIYAWLYIPDTDISYPILQSETDDSFYLTHDYAKESSPQEGAIFTEKTYTSKDFDDPVTVIYGHRLKEGGPMFSQLQPLYSAENGLTDHADIYIFLPDRTLHYTAAAAVPFDNRHLLYNYDFTNSRYYSSFLRSIYEVRDLTAQFREDITLTEEDQLLILSTCLYGNAQNRYLILAKREADIN